MQLSIYRSPRAPSAHIVCTYVCIGIYRNAQIGFTSRGLIDVYAAIAPMVERNPIRRAIRESKRSLDASFVEASSPIPPSVSSSAYPFRRVLSLRLLLSFSRFFFAFFFFLFSFSFLTDREITATRLLSGPGPIGGDEIGEDDFTIR